jgi:hypothetical protein
LWQIRREPISGGLETPDCQKCITSNLEMKDLSKRSDELTAKVQKIQTI